MVKKRGLPIGFDLDLPEDEPVQLGDYLDEISRGSAARQINRVAEPFVPPVEEKDNSYREVISKDNLVIMPVASEIKKPEVEIAPLEDQVSRALGQSTQASSLVSAFEQTKLVAESPNLAEVVSIPKRRPDYARMEINLSPNTQKLVHEIIENVQQYSVQEDTKASEIFQALVEALHQALPKMNLSQVPRRGKWGSPKAHAFRAALTQAFVKAIAKSDEENNKLGIVTSKVG
jgi:hypothetical protein